MSLTATLNRIEQYLLPGMVDFYDRFRVNPLTQAYNDMDQAASDSSGNSLVAASIVFERRIEKLSKLYREFLAVTGEVVELGDYDLLVLHSASLARGDTLCDSCKLSVADRKWIKIYRTYRVVEGVHEPFIASICDLCIVQAKGGVDESSRH